MAKKRFAREKEGSMPKFDAFVFDLDGTLLNTLPDLVALTNRSLAKAGFPTRTEPEILSFVGNGLRALMECAVPEGASAHDVDAVMQNWKDDYAEFGIALTAPYEGMCETLVALKERGKKLAVLSNKFDGGVQEIIPIHFPGIFDAMHGEGPLFPRKPDPTGLLRTAEELGVKPEAAAYVGDSGSDMRVARSAGMFAIGVTWGYRAERELREQGADAVVAAPEELLAFA